MCYLQCITCFSSSTRQIVNHEFFTIFPHVDFHVLAFLTSVQSNTCMHNSMWVKEMCVLLTWIMRTPWFGASWMFCSWLASSTWCSWLASICRTSTYHEIWCKLWSLNWSHIRGMSLLIKLQSNNKLCSHTHTVCSLFDWCFSSSHIFRMYNAPHMRWHTWSLLST